MKRFLHIVLLLFFCKNSHAQQPVPAGTPVIQVAILLDVSESMDGLLQQAKPQIWSMVNLLGKARCNGTNLPVQIALYEYGRRTNRFIDGFVKQLNPLTNNLDSVSKNLFKLTTNGDQEYCTVAISKALSGLKWDTSRASYKAIFIAGNEDFLQGDITVKEACKLAAAKGVIINTIYCGDRGHGIRDHWQMDSTCTRGSYTNINMNAKEKEITTPYDTVLFALNGRLNNTYVYYGKNGYLNYNLQGEVDKLNHNNKETEAKRIGVKGKANLYNNAGWDAVDAATNDTTFIGKIDKATLPDSLRNKTPQQLKTIIAGKAKERTGIQNEIAATILKRNEYLAAEKAKLAPNGLEAQTLQSEIEKIIIGQAKRYNISF